jgi:RNA polymerase sigma-70 factor (ECF subfamily)
LDPGLVSALRRGEWYFVNGQAPFGDASESLVVKAAREGDHSAFGRLYDRFAPMVHGILLARVPAGEVDDLVQDVFLLAFTRIGSLRQEAAFGGWLAAIARNRAVDFYRRPREVTETADQESHEPIPRDARRDEAANVLEAIRTLPEAYRETLILRLVEGMTGPEIAARTGLTPGSVRVNLHRGMQQLRRVLGDPQGLGCPSAGEPPKEPGKRNRL